MATYDKVIDYDRRETYFKLKEHVVYGSSRVGIRTHDLDLLRLQTQGFSMRSVHYSIGSRQYELTNHLGNVLSVVSDKVIPYFYGGGIKEMWADIRVAQDYSPFGVTLSRRNFSVSEGYRYGFQGQEMDDEVKGKGNSVNYKYRMHDPRIGRFFAIDPLTSKYPFYSPYAFSGNIVLCAVEMEGLEPSWLKPWYILGESDIAKITSGMSESRAALFKSTATKVKLMHDNYVSGINSKVEFTPEELSMLTGGDAQATNMGGDGVRNVTAFSYLKDAEGRPISKNNIPMYPIRTIGVKTVNGLENFDGQLKNAVSPLTLKVKSGFSFGNRVLNNLLQEKTSMSSVKKEAERDANALFNGFKLNGWNDGSPGDLSDVKEIEIDYWQNDDGRDKSNAYISTYKKVLQKKFGDAIPVRLRNLDTKGSDRGNSVTGTVVKK